MGIPIIDDVIKSLGGIFDTVNDNGYLYYFIGFLLLLIVYFIIKFVVNFVRGIF